MFEGKCFSEPARYVSPNGDDLFPSLPNWCVAGILRVGLNAVMYTSPKEFPKQQVFGG